MEKRLSEFKVGEVGVVKMLDTTSNLKRRLYDMGVTPGAKILLKKVAPLGDPMQISLRGYELSLRRNESTFIILEVEE